MTHSIEVVDVVYTAEYFHDFWKVLDELQNENIRLVRYRYRLLPWTSLALLPPRGYYLSALSSSSYGLMCQTEWFRSQDSDETWKMIFREFRDLGLLKKDVPQQWVGAYGSWGRLKFGAGSPLFKMSLVMPTSIEDAMIDLLRRMNTSMPDIGLVELPPNFENYPTALETWARPVQYPWRLMTHGLAGDDNKDPAVYRQLLGLMLECLKAAVDALEHGNPIPFQKDVWTGNRFDFFFCRGTAGDSTNLEFADELDVCDAYRARLMRLLRRPEMWYMNANTIHQCKATFLARPPSVPLPYDMIAELEAYDEEVVQTYPWLEENSYKTVGISCERPVYELPF